MKDLASSSLDNDTIILDLRQNERGSASYIHPSRQR